MNTQGEEYEDVTLKYFQNLETLEVVLELCH